MLTNNEKKFIVSLQQKKFRKKENCFVVEGKKMIRELLNSAYTIKQLYGVGDAFLDVIQISAKELKSLSSLKNPDDYIAVVENAQPAEIDFDARLILALDGIADPGNLGTIIRTADWFGVKDIICSNSCVDLYNPKVVQASMGSIFRVNVTYTDLKELLAKSNSNTVYGAFMDGENIYDLNLENTNSILLMGNEANGISDDLLDIVSKKITIPQQGKGVESLNVSIATAILCSEFSRNLRG